MKKVVKEKPVRTRVISLDEPLILEETGGQETLAQATDVFGHIDPDFKNWDTDVVGERLPQTELVAHEIVRDSTVTQMFESLASDLNKLCLSQEQIKLFTRKYRTWLPVAGCFTFFLFKVGEEFFVARVFWRTTDSLLCVQICDFSITYSWPAKNKHRFVVPRSNQ